VRRQPTRLVSIRCRRLRRLLQGQSRCCSHVHRCDTVVYDVPFKATTSTLGSWTAVTVDEVEKLIASALNKACQLDPAPTWLVKEMRGLLAPFVALLFNKTLDTGCFPAEFKQAVVRPLLKKSELDTAEMKNYRPVSISNLSFLSICPSYWRKLSRTDCRPFSTATT